MDYNVGCMRTNLDIERYWRNQKINETDKIWNNLMNAEGTKEEISYEQKNQQKFTADVFMCNCYFGI